MGFLTGKTVIITGGGRAVLSNGKAGAIGYGIATAYAKEGANIVITGRNVKKLEDAKEELERLYGVKVLPVQADISAGGTDILELAQLEELPASIGEIRCGTGILLGAYPLSRNVIPGASQETFRLEGTVLECRAKAGRKLALFDFGCLHTEVARLTAPLPGMALCGTSSAYAVFDVTECPAPIDEGQSAAFSLDYHSLMLALGSRALPVETL